MNRVRRYSFALLAGLATLSLAGCGSKTATVYVSSSLGSYWVVVSGSDSAISGLKKSVSSQSANPLGTATAEDGDQHSGNLVCATDVYYSAAGASVHMALYMNGAGVSKTECVNFLDSVVTQ